MKRRTFIAALGATVARSLQAGAQQREVPVVGYLSSRSPAAAVNLLGGFRKGITEAGYIEGRNVIVEYRWAEEQCNQLPALAADLVRRRVAVIVADGTPTTLAAKAATSTIPIVFQGGLDPVAFGLVKSINRPDGNITGITSLNVELGPKRLELIHELLPTVTALGALINPEYPAADTQLNELRKAADIIGVQLYPIYAATNRDLEMSLATLEQRHLGGLVINADGFFLSRTEQIAQMALRYKVPAISTIRDFAFVGGLMSYGGNIAEQFRAVGAYVGRILQGEGPCELPVQQITTVELIINIRTAKALGVVVPQSILLRADEVIE